MDQSKKFLKIIFSVSLLVWLYYRGQIDFVPIFNAYRNPVPFCSLAFCCIMAVIAPIFRWWILIRIQNLPLNIYDAIRLTMVANFFNILIPGGSGGDLIRAYYTMRDCPENKMKSLAIAVVDRGTGIHALFILSVAAIFMNFSFFETYPIAKVSIGYVFMALIFCTFLPILLFWKRFYLFFAKVLKLSQRSISTLDEIFRLHKQKAGLTITAYLLSIVNVLFNILAIHFAIKAVGGTPLMKESFLFAPLIVLANFLPISPGGIGVAEGVSAALYSVVGQSSGATGMLLVRMFIIFTAFIGFPFYLINKRLTTSLNS